MKKLLFSGLTLGALILGISPAEAAKLVNIDTFDSAEPNPTILELTGSSPQAVVTNQSSTHNRVANATPNIYSNLDILGGERELRFSRVFADATGRKGSATIDPELGTLSIDNGTGFNSKTSVIWNGIGSAGLGAAGDLSEQDFFGLAVNSIDLNVSLALTVSDNSGKANQVTVNKSDPGAVRFLFSQFPDIDFSQVKSIQLDVTGPARFDVEIDVLTAESIPEPGTLLGSVLVLGLGAFTKKREAKL